MPHVSCAHNSNSVVVERFVTSSFLLLKRRCKSISKDVRQYHALAADAALLADEAAAAEAGVGSIS